MNISLGDNLKEIITQLLVISHSSVGWAHLKYFLGSLYKNTCANSKMDLQHIKVINKFHGEELFH